MLKKPLSDPPSCTEDLMAVQDSLDILGGKWKLLILHYLLKRQNISNTFKKIEKDINGISAKVLSKELKDLEAHLLVKREVLNTQPQQVQYSITEHGKSTQEIIQVLVNWGKIHRINILKS